MQSAVKYYLSYLRFPQSRDYIRMGQGIESRYKRCRDFWQKHIDLCKLFQTESLKGYDGKGSICVLGAGSLLDIDIEHLDEKFSTVKLFDANPALVSKWKKVFKGFSNKVSHNITDITGSIQSWTDDLQSRLINGADENNIAEFFNNLSSSGNTEILKGADVVFSLNLLSQIPIYWRDRVDDLLKKYLQPEIDLQGNYNNNLQQALEKTMRILQTQHLQMLSSCGAKIILLITDLSFYYYLKDQPLWQEEKALYIKKAEIADYRCSMQDTWHWHIAPQGIEQDEYGSIHKVAAYKFDSN